MWGPFPHPTSWRIFPAPLPASSFVWVPPRVSCVKNTEVCWGLQLSPRLPMADMLWEAEWVGVPGNWLPWLIPQFQAQWLPSVAVLPEAVFSAPLHGSSSWGQRCRWAETLGYVVEATTEVIVSVGPMSWVRASSSVLRCGLGPEAKD